MEPGIQRLIRPVEMKAPNTASLTRDGAIAFICMH
jgi:hypothetical protein